MVREWMAVAFYVAISLGVMAGLMVLNWIVITLARIAGGARRERDEMRDDPPAWVARLRDEDGVPQ